MKRILFVCLGNICRSPVAEGIFNQLVSEQHLEAEFLSHSAGTAGYHIGEPPHPTSSSVAKEYGVSLNHRGRQFAMTDFDSYDLILCMDRQNYQSVYRQAASLLQKSKVGMIGQFLAGPEPAPIETAPEIPDPYYGPVSGFHEVHNLLTTSNRHLIAYLSH